MRSLPRVTVTRGVLTMLDRWRELQQQERDEPERRLQSGTA
jgi:hypothetical protein